MEERKLKSCLSASVPVQKVAALFRCSRCLTAPLKPPVFSCRSGHLTCSSCNRGLNDSCKTCKEPFLGRNVVLEEVLRELPVQTCRALQDCTVPLRESRSEQSLQYILTLDSHVDQLEQARLEAERRSKLGPMGDYCANTSDSSATTLNLRFTPCYRPAPCPYDCRRVVTCSSLYPHFELHHPEVRVCAADLEKELLVELLFEDVLYSSPHCGAFLLVRLEDKDHFDENWMKPANLLEVSKSAEVLRKGVLMATLSVSRLYLPMGSRQDEGDDYWFMAVWVACLYKVCPVNYTLRVSNEDDPYSVSYRGCLVPLHESQDPRDVCAKGQCLLLTPGLLKQVHFGSLPLKVYITFHMDPLFNPCSQTSSDDRNLSSV